MGTRAGTLASPARALTTAQTIYTPTGPCRQKLPASCRPFRHSCGSTCNQLDSSPYSNTWVNRGFASSTEHDCRSAPVLPGRYQIRPLLVTLRISLVIQAPYCLLFVPVTRHSQPRDALNWAHPPFRGSSAQPSMMVCRQSPALPPFMKMAGAPLLARVCKELGEKTAPNKCLQVASIALQVEPHSDSQRPYPNSAGREA